MFLGVLKCWRVFFPAENQNFLVDVGFGKFSLEPLKLELNRKIIDSYGEFQFDKYSGDYYRINEIKNNEVIPQYTFQNEGRELYEFQERCDFPD